MADSLGCKGKWQNLAGHPPDRIIHPDTLDAYLETRPALEMVFHMGAVSSTSAIDGDHTWATNVELSRRLWSWCAERGVRFLYASSASTYGDGAHGFDDDGSPAALEKLRPPQPVWLVETRLRPDRRAPPRRGAGAAAAMGRAEILQRLRAE